MSKAVVSRNRFREHRSGVHEGALEELLRAFVSVEVAQLEMQNRVSDDAEAEMSRLNDAGVNGADGHFRDALALHLQEAVLALRPRNICPPGPPSDTRRRANSRGKSRAARSGCPAISMPYWSWSSLSYHAAAGTSARDGADAAARRQHRSRSNRWVSDIKDVVNPLLAVRSEASENE